MAIPSLGLARPLGSRAFWRRLVSGGQTKGKEMNFDELKAKYPPHVKMRHGPNPNCPYCKGTGEKTVKLSTGPYQTVCMCTYVDHSVSTEMIGALAETATKVLKEFRDD